MENQYIGGRNCLRKEGLGSLQIYGGRGPDKKEGVVFLSGEREVDISMYTIISGMWLWKKYID